MPYTIGANPPDLQLNTYDGDPAGVNDTSQYNLSSANGKVTLVSFIKNSTAFAWLNNLVSIKTAYPAVEVVGVVFRHNGTNFQTALSSHVVDAVTDAGKLDSDFLTIPLLVGDDGAWPNNFLQGILTNPDNAGFSATIANYDTWSYILTSDHVISDKWRSETTLRGDPIFFDRITVGANGFNSADFGITETYVKQRLQYLSSSLVKLSESPADGSIINTWTNPVSVLFSKPLATGPAGTSSNYALSGGGLSTGAGNANPADYTGANKVENVVALTYTGVTLTDSSDNDTVSITITNITDTATPAGNLTGDNVIEYTADLTAPQPDVAFKTGYASPTNQDPVKLIVDFHEVVKDFDMAELGVSNATITAKTPSNDASSYEIDVAPLATVTDDTVEVWVPAAITQDLAGHDNLASATPNFNYRHDEDKPAPVIASTQVINGGTTSLSPFTITVDFGEPVEGSLVQDNCTLTNCTFNGAPAADSNNQVFTVIVVPSAAGLVDITVKVDQLSDEAGNQNLASNTFSVTYSSPDVVTNRDIVLLMDLSTSMSWDVTLNTASGPDIRPKIDFMKPEIVKFLDELHEAVGLGMADGNDEYGFVTYHDTGQNVQINGTDMVTLASAADYETMINNFVASGSTAMGPGLAVALHLLDYSNSSARERAIVMFADGEDNVPPYVETDASSFTIHDPGGGSSGFPVGIGDVTVNQSDPDKIPIHAIGITTQGPGDSSPWLDKLEHLSSVVTGGIDHATADNQIWPDAEYNFQDILEAIYNGGSPQVIYRHRSNLEHYKRSAGESVYLNRGIGAIMVCLSWPGGTPLKADLYKNGVKIPGFTEAVRRDTHVIYTLKFPAFMLNLTPIFKDDILFRQRNQYLKGEIDDIRLSTLAGRNIEAELISEILGESVSSDGNWDIVVRRQNSESEEATDYSLSVIADDRAVHYVVEYPVAAVFAGDRINIGLRVKEHGVPIDALYEARINVRKPAFPLGNILAKYASLLPKIKAKTVDPTSVKDMAAVQMDIKQRLQDLKGIPQAAAEKNQVIVDRFALRPKWKVVNKKIKSDTGHFCRRYARTDVPGVYRFDIRISGVAPDTGLFERTTSRTVLVRPAVSRRHSLVTMEYDKGKSILRIAVTPKDKFGNWVGPGLGKEMAMNFASREDLLITDNLDGTYVLTVKIPIQPSKLTGFIKVTLSGRTIYKFRAKGLISKK